VAYFRFNHDIHLEGWQKTWERQHPLASLGSIEVPHEWKALYHWAKLHDKDDQATRTSCEISPNPLRLASPRLASPRLLRSRWNIEPVASRMINRFKPLLISPRSILFSQPFSYTQFGERPVHSMKTMRYPNSTMGWAHDLVLSRYCYTLPPLSPSWRTNRTHSFTSNFITKKKEFDSLLSLTDTCHCSLQSQDRSRCSWRNRLLPNPLTVPPASL
jgi:hypothetical protein